MNRVVITEELETHPPDAGFSFRHPELSYLFGDMVRGLYVVGCLAADLLGSLQVHLSFPTLEGLLLPPLAAGFLALAYLELRLYRVLWPPSRRRRIIEIVEGGRR